MLLKNIFFNISSRTSAKLFYSISLYPFLYLITLFLPTNFMQVGGIENGLSGLDFYYGILLAQSQFAIPLILITYFTSLSFYEEINSGKLIFYKDIKRSKLLNSKLFSLILMYTTYFILLFISSEILYYIFINNFKYASGNFLPNDINDLYTDLLSILSIISISYIAVFFATFLSMKFSTGFTILGVILLFMIISIAPLIKGAQYLFPNGFTNANNLEMFLLQFLIIIIISFVYISFFYLLSLILFKKIEY
ncbi:amino acid transporter [Staphylococcus hominis]|uniref:amino acid transporter n=1 Tax=Staphylococcus hominis TaxID=1290 RepID=UPI001F56BFA2|nr:amino acid transporter [Staphylococcus hominis]MCI2928341.1 amino acid transporter [Staphylococcus hominis]MDS3852895.1 amino acid transporter [Staphylococcus hominis]